MVPAALGTQTGGSTLRPAAYNGIVGLKASYGLVSNRGVIAVAWSFDHVGILARSVADAAGVLGVIAGHDPLDLSSAPEAAGFILPALDARRPPTIGLIRTHFLEVCEPEVLAHTLEVAAKLEASGAQGREIVLPRSYGRIAATVQRIFRPETYASHRERYEQRGHLYGPKIAALIEEGRGMPAFEYVEAARERPSVVAELEAALAGVDIALTPAPAPRDRSTTGDAAFQVPWSYAGLPAVALPSGLNAWGLPLGVQLVGHRWADDRDVVLAHGGLVGAEAYKGREQLDRLVVVGPGQSHGLLPGVGDHHGDRQHLLVGSGVSVGSGVRALTIPVGT
jgi:Asp-tRNA(Asn)/Glu-tRNA(Gln) amidotransferase A subunit family amidase